MLVAIALCNRGGKEEWHHFQWEAWKGRSCQERRTTINKANEMAVESGERWNGWLGLTHYLIYPRRPCEHSGVIHYFTSSITPRGQAKRPSPHPQLPPRDPAQRVPSVGERKWWRTASHIHTHTQIEAGVQMVQGAVHPAVSTF